MYRPVAKIIGKEILDELTSRAQFSPRLRMNLDLRNSPSDGSQRMLNAIEPGSLLPIHRHRKSSETVVCLRGRLVEALVLGSVIFECKEGPFVEHEIDGILELKK